MILHLGYELSIAGVLQPKGEVMLDLELFAADGQIKVEIKSMDFPGNKVFRLLGPAFLKTVLADVIAKQINEAIQDVPSRDSRIKRLEILNGNTGPASPSFDINRPLP